MQNWNRTFKQAFCEHYQCPEERYVTLAARRALPWRARFLRPLILLLRPDHFRLDFELLERVGGAQNWDDVHAALSSFGSINRMSGGFYRNRVKLRASGRRVTQMVRRLIAAEGGSEA